MLLRPNFATKQLIKIVMALKLVYPIFSAILMILKIMLMIRKIILALLKNRPTQLKFPEQNQVSAKF